ncbi:MAG TPA: D-glucuronyl C5-epimerase family protein [Gaiellaceae bacterium]|nr:D-glucuronyl C5-epimerase family protein [Gaiellaceae bacterium]
MRGLTGLVFATVALLVATGAAAAPRPVPGERAALAAVKHALKSGSLTRAAAKADRAEITRAVHLARALPAGRRIHVEVALEEIGALGKELTAPRALALFGQLQANVDYFAHRAAPRNGTDITGPDGIVYRYFTGRCFEFHPLANVSTLNARVAAKDVEGTKQLADALAARAVPRSGGGIVWEYYFPFGGRPPWVSGMAQAVGAQAFARAAALVTDESAALLHEATSAFRMVPRLTTKLAAGPWIRLYSFSANPVLNAQLQTVLSLQTYAAATNDTAAAALAVQMEEAAAATVARFDTGYWSYYSLAGNPSPLSYQKFVVQLLHKLAPADPRFAQAAERFATYLKQPPAFKLASGSAGTLRFWLSKPASVSARTPAGRSVRLSLGAGWHTFRWGEPKRTGFYPVTVSAVDWAGNRASFSALPIVHVPASRHSSTQARRTSAASPAAAAPAFAAGVGIDDPEQAALAGPLGLGLVRMSAAWQPGQTTPNPAVVSSLRSLPSGTGLVLELSAAQLPTDDTGRSALAGYAASLAQQAPALRYLALTPAPTAATAAAYADALAAVRAAVVAVRSDVAVGLFFDGSVAQPQRAALNFGQRLAHDGAPADFVSFQPAAAPGDGVWASGDVGQLESALAKRLGTAPPVLLHVAATPTTVPSAELGAYTGGPPPTGGAVSPAVQASAYADAIEAASCSTDVRAVLLDRLVDVGSAPEPATGLYYASGDAKPSAAAVKGALRAVARGAVVCPGVAARVTPTTLTFPAQLSSSSAASVVLGCSRDCLYLLTLDRANGQPVLARRGTLNGGDPATTITLPKRTLSPGGYRLDLRLVSRVGPGTVTRQRSAVLTVG